MAIELAAEIAALTACGAEAGALASLSVISLALPPGLSGAGTWPVGRVAAFGGDLVRRSTERLLLSASSRDSSASIASLALGLRRLQFGEARLGFGAGRGDFALAWRRSRRARSSILARSLGEPRDRVGDLVAQRLDPVDDRVVVALDPAQVFGLGGHLGPVVRFEDRVDDVRRAGLVDRDEAVAQHVERALQLVADLFEVRFSASSAAVARSSSLLLFGQFGLDRGLFWRSAETSPIIESIARFCSAIVSASELWSGADVFELALRRVELFLRGLRRRARLGQREGAERRQQQRREEQRAPWSARMSVEQERPHRVRAVPEERTAGRRRLAKSPEDC